MIEFKQKFIEDAAELLADLEQATLKLESDTNNSSLIEEIFRSLHTLKGTSAMFGFEDMGNLAHRLENLFDLVRNGRMAINKIILEITLQSADFMNKVLRTEPEQYTQADYQSLYHQIDYVLAAIGEDVFDGNRKEIQRIAEQEEGMHTWFILIKPIDDLRKRGIKMHVIFDELDKAGQNHIFNRSQRQTEGPGIYWEIFLATENRLAEIEDILLFISDISTITPIAPDNLFDNNYFRSKLNDFTEQESISIEEVQLLAKAQEKPSNEPDPTTNKSVSDAKQHESIKVAAERLDEQMVLLSELVTTKAELQLLVERNGYKNLAKPIEQLEKITRRFRKNIFKIRLIPIENLKLRFDRLIRDLSKQLNKEVDFVTEGLSTELDKNIIDSLESPIMHLIRNCLDHGIEAPDIRKMRNKSGKGTISLIARRAAANVFLTVSDDGEGLNPDMILEKAIQKGLVEKGQVLSKSEIFDLIFQSGFSTALNLTEVSGRGVGMDVVKQTINQLRGSIEIESEKGKGAAFTIKLPLSLSIIDTMLVKAGEMYYSIPLPSIIKCTEILQDSLSDFDNKHLTIDDELLPYLILKDKLHVDFDSRLHNTEGSGKPENDEIGDAISLLAKKKHKVVIVRNENQKAALIVDEVIGEHQAVLKPLGHYFSDHKYLSGASQLADGRISLVLDTGNLIK